MNHSSLIRQRGIDDHRLVWVIGDDLHGQRESLARWKSLIPLIHFQPRPKPEGYFSDLAGIYNQMIEAALDWGAELIVSLQDYFWLPEDGLARFVELNRQVDGRGLYTGAASLMNDPPPSTVVQPTGGWTVYADSFDGRMPTDFFWRDCRLDNHAGQPDPVQVSPVEWELNWAAWPAWMCREGLRFDEEFGRGIAYENQDFAWRAFFTYEALCYMDKENHARGLPHKQYWPEQEQEGLPHALSNKDLCDAKWGGARRIVIRSLEEERGG